MKKNKIINLFHILLFFLFFLNSNLLYGYTYQEGLSSYEDGNKAKAFRIWYLLSLEGNSNADYGLGLLYLNGFEHLNNNNTLALEYLQKADNANITEATYLLGTLYEKGEKVSQNNKKAFKYYTKAVADDHLLAMKKLAKSYEFGTLSPPDAKKSCELWNAVVSFGDIEGYYKTALCFKYSKGGIKDFDKAIEYLTLSGDKGIKELFIVKFETEEINCDWYEILHQKNSEGTYYIAKCYRDGKGRAENLEVARKLFEELIGGEKTLDQEGKLELADMYLLGIGGDQKMSLANVLLLSIRDGLNSTDLQIKLAKSKLLEVDFGWDECKQELDKMDDSKAKQICLKVADKGQACAMIKVSDLYESGQSGFEKDLTESKKWKIQADLACGIGGTIHSGYQTCKCD